MDDIVQKSPKEKQKNGYKEEVFANGSKYKGYWVHNQKHGKGILTYKDGSYYEGSFYKDKRQGYGKH